MQTIIPKFVESQVGSENNRTLIPNNTQNISNDQKDGMKYGISDVINNVTICRIAITTSIISRQPLYISYNGLLKFDEGRITSALRLLKCP